MVGCSEFKKCPPLRRAANGIGRGQGLAHQFNHPERSNALRASRRTRSTAASQAPVSGGDTGRRERPCLHLADHLPGRTDRGLAQVTVGHLVVAQPHGEGLHGIHQPAGANQFQRGGQANQPRQPLCSPGPRDQPVADIGKPTLACRLMIRRWAARPISQPAPSAMPCQPTTTGFAGRFDSVHNLGNHGVARFLAKLVESCRFECRGDEFAAEPAIVPDFRFRIRTGNISTKARRTHLRHGIHRRVVDLKDRHPVNIAPVNLSAHPPLPQCACRTRILSMAADIRRSSSSVGSNCFKSRV